MILEEKSEADISSAIQWVRRHHADFEVMSCIYSHQKTERKVNGMKDEPNFVFKMYIHLIREVRPHWLQAGCFCGTNPR